MCPGPGQRWPENTRGPVQVTEKLQQKGSGTSRILLGGALPGHHKCLGRLVRSVHSSSLNTQVPMSWSSPSAHFQPRARAQSWNTGARTQGCCEFLHLEISFPTPRPKRHRAPATKRGRNSKTNRKGWGRQLLTEGRLPASRDKQQRGVVLPRSPSLWVLRQGLSPV